MKTYLVTGGAGFIGSNFVLFMLENNTNIKIVTLDALTYAGNLENLKSIENDNRHIFVHGSICDTDLLQSLFNQYNFDVVVNFAAESHVDRSILNPEVFADTNILGTLSLLKIAKNAWEKEDSTYRQDVKYLQVSTDEVYGSLGETGFFTETTPLDPHSPYAASKAAADLFVKSYWDTYRLPVNITRCSNNYGPFQFPEKLIPLMITNILEHKELPVYGDGLQVRDWLYVEDHCRAISMVIESGILGEVYNVGGHNEKTNLSLITSIISYIQKNVAAAVSEELITYVTDRKGHDRRYGIDASKIQKHLGWEPTVPFSEGIVKTIQWYLKNTNWLRQVTSGAYQEYYENMYKGR